jgi:polynucleotide 5'-hydroxyl-kinase GRC3/NOL9
MEIIPAAGWKILSHELTGTGGTTVILGATDSGKSTLARYIIERFLALGKKVCLVDADVGQSALGLPATICMKGFAREGDLGDYRFDRMFFVGDVNPAKRIPLMIAGTKSMSAACADTCEAILVDTSGLVSGKAAEVLKTGKIRAIAPRHIVALQRDNELEDLLGLVGDVRIHRVGVSAVARTRKVAERAAYRRDRFAHYFRSAGNAEFRLGEKEARSLHRGKPLELSAGLFPEGTVIGLNAGGETLALGLVVETEDRAVLFRSPLPSLRMVNAVEFGDIRFD